MREANASSRSPRVAVIDTPRRLEHPAACRAKFGQAELYVPPWFSTRDGHYDLIVHFHGLGRLQEQNLEKSQINAAVVSVNHGVGTDAYSAAFRDPAAFDHLLAATRDEMAKSGCAPNADIGRIALSAWSAGFVSVAKILNDPSANARVDAVLLADGFFVSYVDLKRHVINTAPLQKFVVLADSASRGEKLFAITHTAIPTSGYPSVEETVGHLLEMTSDTKVTSQATGPRNMHERYTVDRGSFHVKGYEGVLAGDHIKQIQAMGETLWPYLKARWDADGSPSSRQETAIAPNAPNAPTAPLH